MYNRPITDASLLQRLPYLALGGSARCLRCDEELSRRREDPLNRTLALAIASAILYVVANSAPMLGLTVVGREASTTVFGGAEHLWNDGRQTVACLVFFTAILAPALQIGLTLAIAIGAHRDRPRPWVGMLLRHHQTTRTWSMIEVMMLGVLVALVKIADYATVIPGVALFALGGLIFLLAATQATFDSRDVWQRIEWREASSRHETVPRLAEP
jgi:paraquat-inducible protein A